MSSQAATAWTVAGYLVERLRQLNVGHIFSVPGTACADFILAVSRVEGMQNVGTSNELEAGYAADGYARLRGVGVVCATYGVGTLSLINATAGSLVEKCRVVVVNGGPSARELWLESNQGILFSHSTGRARTDYEMFRQVTAAAEVITSAANAPEQIDAALVECLTRSQPVYVEVANDLWNKPCRPPQGQLHPRPAETNEAALAEAVAETLARLRSARMPVLWVGEEVQRFGLEELVLSLVERSGLPFASTLLGKAVLPEDHEKFVGVYDSDLAPKVTRDIVEKSDCVLALGTIISVDHTVLVSKSYGNMVLATADVCRVGYKPFAGVPLQRYVEALAEGVSRDSFSAPELPAEFALRLSSGSYADRRAASMWGEEGANTSAQPQDSSGAAARGITYESFFHRMDRFIDENMVLLVDTCLGSYPGADLRVRRRAGFVAQPVWLSIGYAVGATLGAGCAIGPGERAIAIVGDGGFQMVAQAFSTIARQCHPAVMFVINNGLYGIEQFLIRPDFYKNEKEEPLFFNRLAHWRYAQLPQAFGGGRGLEVSTMQELEDALEQVKDLSRGPTLIEVHIPPKDLPPENREFIGS